MAVKFETPPVLKGQHAEQLEQIYRYLFRLSENLNVALSTLTKDNFVSAAEHSSVLQGVSSDSGTEGNTHSYNELRSLIVNTAEIVRSQMTKIETELKSEYTALSQDWGTFQENVNSTIEATASGVVQSYGYDAQIQTLQEQAAGFSAYQISTEGYIRQGFIDYDEEGIPILGIAIGQELTSAEVEVNGETYRQIDRTQNCAFYTSEKVSFRINGQEVAYVSNRKLYIGDVEINGTVILGGEWIVKTTNGLVVKWIGGDV